MAAENRFDVVVLGAGAAGLMCAFEAGKRGRRVAVLERADRIGKKILISGGGRCNFTNLHCTPDNFLSANPHFAKSPLARYTPQDFISMVNRHGIAWHEKTLGQLFCDHSAHEIVNMLESECRTAGVQIFTGIRVQSVEHTIDFLVRADGQTFRASALVVATGGLSIPKMGATGFGYDLARQFGLAIVPLRPALVPLVFHPDDQKHFTDLSGVSSEIVASIGRKRFREKMLITHRGLSGPAILQISSYWKTAEAITIDLAPQGQITSHLLQENGKRNLGALKTALRSTLPQRLADRWLDLYPPNGWSNSALGEFERQIHSWQITPEETEGYEKAEVTAGGVDTNELSAKTMETRKVPGLYFIGEVVDVTGHLGGFNFQWAWSTGFVAARGIERFLTPR